MLRQDANSRLGGDITYFVLDGSADATVLRFDLHGHYVDPASGAGVYAQVPVTWFSENDNTETVLGGVEVGGIYIPKFNTPGFGMVLRGGITLPTVSDDDTALAGLVATYLRPIDLYAQIPKSSTLRLGASPMFRSGKFFARIDAGLDVNVYIDGSDTVDPGIVLDLGAGFDFGNAAIMGELSTLAITGDNGESISSFALSVRGNAGAVQPYGALIIPMDSDVKQTFDAGLLAGIEGRL